MNKKLLIVGIVIPLLAVGLSGCTNAFESKEESEEPEPLSYIVVSSDAYGRLSGLN